MPGSLWDLTSPARDETCALSNGSTMSLPLDHQETPHHSALYYWLYFPFVSFRIFHELFIGCAGSKLLRGLLPSCASHCGGFSCGAWAPGHLSSCSCGPRVLEHGLRSCGTRAQLPQRMRAFRPWERFPCIDRQILNNWTREGLL